MTDEAPRPGEAAALREAIGRARAIAAGTGRTPFVAAVLVGDEVLAWGENEVHLAHDPSRHAEVVAIAAAARALGRPTMPEATLVSTLQPCEMCLAAMRWAGIARVVFAVRQEAAGPRYFKFGGLTLADFHAAADRGFEHLGGPLEEEAIDLYADAPD